MRLPHARQGGALWCRGRLGPLPFGPSPTADSLEGSGENVGQEARGMGGCCGGPEASLPEPLPQGADEELRACFSVREASRPLFPHTRTAALLGTQLPSGWCLLGAGALGKKACHRDLPRSGGEAAKAGKKVPPPPPASSQRAGL